MRTLFVIDPLDTLNLATETSLLLIEELSRRGLPSFIATIQELGLCDGEAAVRAREIRLDLGQSPFYRLGTEAPEPLSAFDLVLMRKDPPVDDAYVFATHVLEQAARRTVVLNDPVSLRLFNEKLLPLRFPDLSPPTLVTPDRLRLLEFASAHPRVVLKPLNDCSGRGIRIVDAPRAEAEIDTFLAARPGEPAVVQQFLPGVVRGDKRIFLLDGDPIGAVNRVPRSAEHLANIHQGARVEATVLTAREIEIAARLKPLLTTHGICVAGIDVIDGFLTEVNITSPSAVRQINAVSSTHLERPIVDALLARARRPAA